jgi:uncharacterized delta-60 repeat protein
MHSRSTGFIESLEPRALLAAGAIDSSYSPPFNNVDNRFSYETVVHMQFDGKSIHYANINDKQTLWRQNPNGSLDKTFGTKGKVVLDQKDHVGDMTVAPDGKVLVVYANAPGKRLHLARYTAAGTLDQKFGGRGELMLTLSQKFYPISLILQDDGKIVIGGESSPSDHAVLYRVNANGSLDNSFGTLAQSDLGSGYISDLDIRRADHRIVAVGQNSNDWTVWVLAPNGTVEWTGELPQVAPEMWGSLAQSVAVDGDGSIVVGGYYGVPGVEPHSGSSASIIVRYPAPNSSAPLSYSNDVAGGWEVELQPDGKVLAPTGGEIARFNYDLTLDRSFGESGISSIGTGGASIAIQGDGNILIDGSGNKFGETRLLGDSPTAVANGKNKLKILGTSANDVIKISKSAGLLAVSRNGAAPFYFTASKVKRLIIDAGSGDDTIILSKSVPAAIINGGDGDDTLIGKRRKDKTTSIEHVQ